ncbi:hypothetical protein [Kineobactrum salinum]|uniref:Uncharacterized protein n=1 Tax=Kineobactrum salinum TaxID=2708301 RepID=A0A6C0TZ95_9GAMM|nr:hypothetical protein [Kineobactrum salinum]QIB65140.1 hypothetical protein G3T16_06715 [Kineobactrum salinum]
MLEGVRTQLEVADFLGYGDKREYKELYRQLKSIEQKTAHGKSGKGWFDKITQQLADELASILKQKRELSNEKRSACR